VITACHLHDLGAGGIVADGGDHLAPIQYRTGKNTVTDNLIENTGHIWPSACGITFANSFANQIIHNELTDLTYTGISVGWVWGFGENVSRDNRVEYNNIHHLAIRAGLSDLGGIYTLGIQPGTVIRGNHIHDIENSAYGGQGIYLDEGSSCMLVEQNLVHHCASHAFCEHFGKNKLVRDNLFLLCGDKKDSTGQPAGSVAMICRVLTRNASIPWPPRTTSLYRNVFLTQGAPMLLDHDGLLEDNHLDADLNIYRDIHGKPPVILKHKPYPQMLKPGMPGRSGLIFSFPHGSGKRHRRCDGSCSWPSRSSSICYSWPPERPWPSSSVCRRWSAAFCFSCGAD